MEGIPASQARVPMIIKLAMMLSVVIYPAVMVLLQRSGQLDEQTPVEDANVFFMVALVVAAVSLILSFWFPSFVASDDRIEAVLRNSTSPGEQPSVGAAFSVLFTAFILRLALLESIAIFGLVLSFLTVDASYVIGFSAVSFIFMAMARLDIERAEAICRRIDSR